MADHVVEGRTDWPTGVKTRVKDMGDGTHALVLCVTGSTVSVTGSTVTVEGTLKIQGETDAGAATTLRVDSDQNALLTIDGATHDVHQGERYVASYVIPHGSELGNDATQDFLFITGRPAPHVSLSIAVGGNSEFLIFENPEIFDNGTALTRKNKNRTSNNLPEATAFHTPNVTSAGTFIKYFFIPVGSGIVSVGGTAASAPWVFLAGTRYLFRLTNRSGAGIMASLVIEWSEH